MTLMEIKSPAELRRLKPEELPAVCQEIRETIVETIAKLGGHLGASLGATELTTALHYVFETPKDRLVWDTGHQAYGHKLLTGRLDRFATIRQKGGLSGFLKRDESEYDTFGAGHASTAISAALGMAEGRDQKKEDFKVVAIVSDGCMTGGMCYEALQNAGQLGTNMLVVLNDNQMFISHRVGALGKALTKLLTLGTLRNAEKGIERFLKRFTFWGPRIFRVAKRAKVLLFPGMMFEELGFAYFGPVDGHDVQGLVRVLGAVKELKGPVLLHVVTKKGKGYAPAEEKPITWHGPGRFDVKSGKLEPSKAGEAPSYTKRFSEALLKEAAADPKIVAISAAMPEGTGLDAFRDKFPKRYYDVGLAEPHAVTFAAGLACEGLKPVVAIYSTFLQRAFDQIVHDVCLQKLPVVFILDRGGLVGNDGPTHHGAFDLTYLRMIPGMVVMAPMDENELQHMLRTAFQLNQPVAIRYPRGAGEGVPMDAEPRELPIGLGSSLREGSDVTLAAIGNRVRPALRAAELLEARGISAGVINLRFAKPLDEGLLRETAQRTPRIVTVEDNTILGGAGTAVLETLSASGARFELLRLGLPDRFVEHGTQKELYDIVGLSPERIAENVAAWLAGESLAQAAPMNGHRAELPETPAGV
jgi:1-deoxy-D-xylulose-5-phosphate synthase